MEKLTKGSFMRKIVMQRLSKKYNISDISFDEMGKLLTQFKNMVDEINLYGELMKTTPISKEHYKILLDDFIIRMKQVELIPSEATADDIDFAYVGAILESLLYANKVFLFCSIVNPDARLSAFKELSSIKNVFIKQGYDTLLMLALIYDNTNNGEYIKGIGEKKYEKFQNFFALNFGIDVIEK